LAYGAVGFVPLYFFGGRVRRIGAREGFVTQAEFVGQRFESRRVTGMMGFASVVAFLPYLVIQLKGAGIVMQYAMGWTPVVGAAVVYAFVIAYVVFGGMRGVGWTNVVQGIVMIVVVWSLGLWVPYELFGGISQMFDQVVEQAPEYLTLPGPASRPTTELAYSSEVLVSVLGLTMWPQLFMKCFTARSARLVRFSVVAYPSFLFFLVPLMFLGYAALLLPGAPTDESVILWLVGHPALGGSEVLVAGTCFAILAASMSTGDSLLHAGGSIFVRDVLVGGLKVRMRERLQTLWMRVTIVLMGVVGLGLLALASQDSVVDLLLLAYAIPIQFVPPTILGIYWRRASRAGAEWGLGLGLSLVVVLFLLSRFAPELYSLVNPAGIQIGVIAFAVNLSVMVAVSVRSQPVPKAVLRRFEL
ncbi:MAG: sodium:solute symporter family protein, partial [Nannocystaceae bacterium]